MTASTLFAATLLAALDARDFLPLLYVAAAVIVGAVVIVLVGRWRKSEAPLGPSPSDELAQYRALYEQGAISEEEYQKLRSLLGGQIRRNLDLAPRPTPGAPASEVATQPPPPDEPPATGIRPT